METRNHKERKQINKEKKERRFESIQSETILAFLFRTLDLLMQIIIIEDLFYLKYK